MSKFMTTRDLVKRLRTRHNLSQQEIADAVGTNQVRISRWERAEKTRSYDDVLRLKALYDLLEKATQEKGY
jgi:transcriptional regulator with XRE-family HTH domain